jgi:hypothetical protein
MPGHSLDRWPFTACGTELGNDAARVGVRLDGETADRRFVDS